MFREKTMQARPRFRVGPPLAVLGAGFLLVGTILHPMRAGPNMATAAFAEYAADRHWVASHLLQLAGAWAMAGSLVLLARKLEAGPAAPWASLGWAAAPESEKAMIFVAAFAVRQIEIGLAGMNCLLLGLMAAVFGMALLADGRLPKWTGLLGITGGIATVAAGVAICYTGFSGLAMAINMPAVAALLVWMVALGILGWTCALY
jgi:hypothetical protein